jgi:2-dehydro-3-deoxy-D-arabinonate dehydratase
MGTFTPRGWRLVRLGGGSEPRLGAIDPAAPQVVRELRERDPIAALRRGLAAGAAEAVGEHVADDAATLATLPLLAPLQPEEIWAAGVTYERSRSARVEESESAADVYDRVYEAERPEIFLKDAGCRRTVGPNEPVGVRSESTWTVPEAELGLVLGADGRILAFIGGNDLTARDIEAANPLYIPQAKLFAACCAIGPAVLVPDDPGAPLEISVRIWDTAGTLVNEDGTSTAKLHRSLEELAGWCVRENPVPDGSVLLTGTGIVPPDEVALAPGYRVEVEVEGIGILANPVRAAS